MKRKRLKQGRDYHGWAWEGYGPEWRKGGTDGLFHFAEPKRPTKAHPTERGRWVRVKFVKVAR